MAANVQETEYVKSIFPNIFREGIAKEDSINEYNKWAVKYDQDLENVGYSAYQTAARKMCELFPEETRAGVNILDIGAGTGLLGIQLKDDGFTRIDALDPAKDMLAEAEKRGVYCNYFVEYLTEKPLAIEKGTYDVIIGSGIFGYSHIPYTAIHEMTRLTKPGGYVILSLRKDIINYKEYLKLEPTMDNLETEGKWKKICRTIYPNYVTNCDGLLYVYQIQ